jgi:hypothetical protein
MKKFIQQTILFAFPILLILIGVEFYIRNSPNSFVTIANYFEKNKEKTEILILGSSHNQCALNPKFFKLKTVNLSYGSQDVELNSTLFFHNVKQMKNLKKVIFELDYHYLDTQREKDYYRYPWYSLYYGIEIQPINQLRKFSFYSSNPKLFNKLFLEKMKPNYKAPIINKYGFEEGDVSDEFSEMKYDSIAIEKSAQKRLKYRHKEVSSIDFKKNTLRIEEIIKYCKQNNIEIYFNSTPVYKTYFKNESSYKKKRFDEFIQNIISKYKVKHFNFENSSRFNIKDFSNDDHLNANGALKFSIIIDSILNKN